MIVIILLLERADGLPSWLKADYPRDRYVLLKYQNSKYKRRW